MTPKYVVLDLETTGLDPGLDITLEIAAIAVDELFVETSRFHAVIGYRQPSLDEVRNGSHEIVRNMHDTSGLWTECARVSNPNLYDVRNKLESWFTLLGFSSAEAGEKVVLLGHSPHAVDRPFLKVDFPGAYKFLSHRMVDIGSFARFISESCGAKVVKRDAVHRAMGDCEIALDEARRISKALRHFLPGDLEL